MARGIIIAMVASLLFAYAAAYYATVTPGRVLLTEPIEIVVTPVYQKYQRETWVPEHEHIRSSFFAPIHHLDRLIRPRLWKPTLEEHLRAMEKEEYDSRQP